MERILVLRGGALGDFIVTLPALALLRHRWPGARIELAGNATAAALARGPGLLDAVHAQHEARWARLFAAGPLPAEFAAWLAGFDLVINYWPDADGDLARRFPVRPGQTFLTTGAMPTSGPAAAHFTAPLRALGLPEGPTWYSLRGDTAPAGRHGPVTVHPGSGSPRKNWPDERWRQLIRELPAPVAVVLGEAEAPRWTPWLADTGVELLAGRSLDALADHLGRCRLFLGHDSGISHLAAACGAPCVLLFGPTDPAIWAPPAPRVRVLRAGPAVDAITPAQVREAVDAALADRS
ncbi:MAG: glycosyltransferase family 9 protein [Opitutaceae bacterium]|nr:glycosyltransferase family 9 protein [Opitutaceae bacterium]